MVACAVGVKRGSIFNIEKGMDKDNWTYASSSLDLLSLIYNDLEALLDNKHGHWELTEDNIFPMLDIIDELKERLENLPMAQDYENE